MLAETSKVLSRTEGAREPPGGCDCAECIVGGYKGRPDNGVYQRDPRPLCDLFFGPKKTPGTPTWTNDLRIDQFGFG